MTRLPKSVASLVVALALTVVAAASHVATGADAAEAHPKPPLDAAAAVAAMQPGWNLGNTLDAVGDDETAWGNPRVTQEQLRQIRAQGFNSIRIPITWDMHLGPAPEYQVDPDRMARVAEIVDWALAEDFYVMINMHHDSWLWLMNLPTQQEPVLARYAAVWTQIADAFRDRSPKLVFESINEPFFAGSAGEGHDAELMELLNTTFYDIVRGSGGGNTTRLLVLPTLHTSPDQGPVDRLAHEIAALADPYLIATIHFYGFWPFSVNVAGFTRFDETVQQDLIDAFDRSYDAFVANGVPVILGEYGLLGFDRHTGTVQQGEKLKFFEFLGYHARIRNITTMLWDNGQHFNRHSFEWNDPDLYAHLSSSWQVRSATSGSDLIFVRKGEPVTDHTITLNLHGHVLTRLTHEGRPLIRNRDFRLRRDQLTLSAATLQRLTDGGEHGVTAVLTAHFSRGVPWKFHVISYEPAVLAGATGTTDAFAIPAAFHGDQVATMEARYADGSNAGPHDWTSFKEFDVTFAPDYDAGEVLLRPAFFAEIHDNSTVHLTFHFWSGELVEYLLTRQGDVIIGTPS